MVLSSESFSTNIARKRSLVCVSSFMDQQVVRFGELARTKSADILLSRPVKDNNLEWLLKYVSRRLL